MEVEMLVANHMKFKDAPHMKESTLKRFIRMPSFEEHLELHRLDCLSSNRRLETYEMVKGRLAELTAEGLRPEPLLTGADLIAAGYHPGPRFTEILRAVEDAQLEGRVRTAGEAMELVLDRFPIASSHA